jgi:copper transport protein
VPRTLGVATAALLALAVAAPPVSLIAPAVADAHAVLEDSRPSPGAALERPPTRVSLKFDEPVESSFGALRVFDAAGERVDSGEVLRPSGEAVAVRLEDRLADGPYTVTYRVVSADSHPVSGGYVFAVGEAGGAEPASVAALLEDDTGAVTEVAFGAVRAVSYAAIALLAGGLAFLALTWLPALRQVGRAGEEWRTAAAAFDRRALTLMVAAAFVGCIGAALGIVLQGATATGDSFWAALDADVLRDVLDTRFGTVWRLRLTAFALLLVLLPWPGPSGGRGSERPAWGVGGVRGAAIAVVVAYLVVSPALAGHAAADGLGPLAALDVLHVAAMSAWVGGVALLALALPAATRLLGRADRTRLLAAVVSRFSTVALVAVGALLASGVLQSVLQLESLAELADTAFGRAILAKSAIFVALVALGAHNRRRSQPALVRLARDGEAPGRAGTALRRAVRAEVGLMVAVLGVTAALVSYSPAASDKTGPFSKAVDLGPARMELTVDPARVGRNAIQVHLFDRRSGRRYDRPRSLSIAATQPERGIGPLELPLRKAGPGHYTAPRAELMPAGDWRLTVRVRISQFEELRAQLEVPIR